MSSSSSQPFDMFRLTPDGMTEFVVRHCGQTFIEVLNQALLRFKNDPGFSLLTPESYLRNREYLMQTVEEIREMHVFFDQHYQNFLRTKNDKVRVLLRGYVPPSTGMRFLRPMAGYFGYRHDYRRLRQSILQLLDACQQKIGEWVEFNQLTHSMFSNGKAEMVSLMTELHKKNKELFTLILNYHEGKHKGFDRVSEFKQRFMGIKRGYDSLLEEAMGLVKAEEEKVKTLVSASEHTENVLCALRKRVFEQDADYSLEHLSDFSSELETLKIGDLLQASETCQDECQKKISAHLQSLESQSQERYCNEVQLKALELTSQLDVELIPGPGLQQEVSNQFDRLANEILALKSRCSKLRTEQQALQTEIVLMREKKISSSLNNSQEI